MSTVTTRRAALRSGVAALAAGLAASAVASVAPDADAELIATHAAFMAAHRRIKWDQAATDLTEDELSDEMDRWYAALERMTELSPLTAKGRRAKVEVAHAAMMSTRGEHQREEACVMSVLADLLGSVAA